MIHKLSKLYPLVVAVIPVLQLASQNADHVSARAVVFPALVAIAVAAIVLALLSTIFRDSERGAFGATLVLVAFFSYGRLCDSLWHRRVLESRNAIETFAMIGFISAIALGGIVLWRSRRSWQRTNQLVGLTALILFAMITVSFTLRYTRRATPRMAAVIEAATAQVPTPQLETTNHLLPDIYYIILDGYARNDVLDAIYGFDNSEFTEGLRERGFYVAEQSRSNYAMTFLSLASSLNLTFVNDRAKEIGIDKVDRMPMYALIQDNAAARALKSAGYKIVHLDTNWTGTETSRVADIRYGAIPEIFRSEFLDVLVRSTMLRLVVPGVAETHLYALDRLAQVPGIRHPTFTFAHLLLPHNPYVFDRHGNVRRNIAPSLQFRAKTGGWTNKQDYLEQMMFLNRRIGEVIDRLIADSESPPVIILQADHGSATHRDSDLPAEQQPKLIQERMPILNAYLVPQECRVRLYSTISPVNTFRVLFSSLFEANLEPLADRQFFSWYKAPYRLIDVTERFADNSSGADSLVTRNDRPGGRGGRQSR